MASLYQGEGPDETIFRERYLQNPTVFSIPEGDFTGRIDPAAGVSLALTANLVGKGLGSKEAMRLADKLAMVRAYDLTKESDPYAELFSNKNSGPTLREAHNVEMPSSADVLNRLDERSRKAVEEAASSGDTFIGPTLPGPTRERLLREIGASDVFDRSGLLQEPKAHPLPVETQLTLKYLYSPLRENQRSALKSGGPVWVQKGRRFKPLPELSLIHI